MITKLKPVANSQTELEVELNKEELREYLEKASETISQAVSIAGFRPGKVPFEILRKEIGDKKILEEALEMAVVGSLAKAAEKEKLKVMASSELKIMENTADLLRYSVRLMLYPEVKLGNYKNLGLQKKEVKVEDKEIEEAVRYILKSRAAYQDFNGPAENGHHLEIDFEVSTGGQSVEGGKSENHPFVLGQGNFIPGFEEQLAGLKKGEAKEFSLEAPDDYYQKSLAGKKLDFKITVKSVKTVLVPELNDDFIKSLGQFSSQEELKKNIAEGIKVEKEQKETERFRMEILDKIDVASKIDLPEKMIEQQLDALIANFDQNLHAQGMELALYLAHLKKSQNDLRKEWRGQAEKQIRQSLILRELGQKENIKVSEQEMEEAAAGLLMRYSGQGQDQSKVDPEELKQKAGEVVFREKVFQYLEENNI
ncbi:MAG: trigger factor [Parcubacteria group bacterium Gr01-1014_44]|nr:MAG: trigger factor [Parcubacteria group bacterium Gr01-1014_44]